jgi:hypothetical protein
MIVPIKNENYIMTPEQEEQMFWDNIKFHSHRWVESSKGYYKCSFCGRLHTSVMPTNIHPLCEKNENIFNYDTTSLQRNL